MRFITQILLLFVLNAANAQHVFYIQYSDKDTNIDISNNFTIKALNRRSKHGIDFSYSDYPVNKNYTDSIKTVESGYLFSLKWFNADLFEVPDSSNYNFLNSLNFVDTIILVKNSNYYKSSTEKDLFELMFKQNDITYADNRVDIVNGSNLKNNGSQGDGVSIAIMDAGFKNVNLLDCFNNINIVFEKNLLNDLSVYSVNSSHGTAVLSVMASNGEFYTPAVNSNYYLFVTEDYTSEFQVEELNWTRAAEIADSLGVDIINTSLGYVFFNDPQMNYSYEDVKNGNTWLSKAESIAFDKGMIVVQSAGNYGDDSWKYLSAGADNPKTLTVGATDLNGNIAPFSSLGFEDDDVIKPDIVVPGMGVDVLLNSCSSIIGNGTSFSAPFTTAMIANLLSKYPYLKNVDIYKLLRTTSSKSYDPDNIYGYGIPDFSLIDVRLKTKITGEPLIFPNPFIDDIKIVFPDYLDNEYVEIAVFNSEGRLIFKDSKRVVGNYYMINLSLEEIKFGTIFVLRLKYRSTYYTLKMLHEKS